MAETRVTTSSITAVSVSTLIAHDTSRAPDVIQVNSSTVPVFPATTTSVKMKAASTVDSKRAPQVIHWAALSTRACLALSAGAANASMPAMTAPRSGRKTTAAYMSSQPFIRLTSSTAMEPRLRK